MGTRKSPAEARTSIKAVLSATGRPRFSLSYDGAKAFRPQLDALRLSQIQVVMREYSVAGIGRAPASRGFRAYQQEARDRNPQLADEEDGGTGAGHSGGYLTSAYSRGVWGENEFSVSEEQVAAHSYHGCAA